jgi:GT2 family glycosyltransferase
MRPDVTTAGAAGITVVVPVRNDRDRLVRCLASVRATAGHAPVEIIVVDNGSTDGSAPAALAFGARVLSCPGERVGALRNRGATSATTPLVAFIDSDHELGEGWGDAALELFADPAVGAAGAYCHPPADGTWVQHAYDTLRDHASGRRDVEWLGAGNLVVRREAFLQTGGFDDALEASEDVDLCRALRRCGWRVVSDSRLRNVHHGDPTTLRRLFRSELWRGRNNATVSLRRPLQRRAVLSLTWSVVQLAAVVGIAGAAVATAASPRLALYAGSASALAFVLLSTVRVVRMARRLPVVTAGHLVGIACVAVTYDVARALALVSRAGHHRRRVRESDAGVRRAAVAPARKRS